MCEMGHKSLSQLGVETEPQSDWLSWDGAQCPSTDLRPECLVAVLDLQSAGEPRKLFAEWQDMCGAYLDQFSQGHLSVLSLV